MNSSKQLNTMNFKAFPYQATHICAPLITITLALVAALLNDQITDMLVYHRNLVEQGEYWRLLTGHFLHTNTNHLLLNTLAVALLWSLHGQYYTPKNYLTVFLVSAVTCNIGIHFFSLDINQYVGLSGVLHGIFIWGACQDIKNHDKTGYLLLVGVIVKLAHEQVYGASDDVIALISSNVAINAHLWGAIGGLLLGVYLLKDYKKASAV